MLQRIRQIAGFFTLLISFTLSYQLTADSLGQEKFLDVSQIQQRAHRDIATLRGDLGINKLSDHLLISTSPLRVLTQAKVIATNHFSQLTLGHFGTKDRHGNPAFACQVYDMVTVTYESSATNPVTNPATSTQTMLFEQPCKMDEDDIKHLTSITIPFPQILNSPPGDGLFPFPENGNLTVRFQNIENEWPKYWTLKSVRFSDSKNKLPVNEISALDLPPNQRHLLDIKWSDTKN